VRPNRSFQLLLSLQELHNLCLLLPPATITYKRHIAQSTIDLVFSSSSLSQTLTACRSREDLDHGSDNYPSKSSFLFSSHKASHLPKPLWKKAHKVALSQSARELDFLPRTYEKCEDIDS
jgi:hypothetical protein